MRVKKRPIASTAVIARIQHQTQDILHIQLRKIFYPYPLQLKT